MKLNSGKAPPSALATAEDLRHFLGDLNDSQVVEILSLEPTIDQIGQTMSWMAGEGDRLSREGRPLEGVVAKIFDILAPGDEEDDRRSS
jgi:hypothetical protein